MILEIRVGLFLLPDRGSLFFGVVVAWEENCFVWKSHELLGKTSVHILRASPGKIDPAAGADKKGVPCNQPTRLAGRESFEKEALGARSVTWSMNHLNLDPSHINFVSALSLDDIRSGK